MIRILAPPVAANFFHQILDKTMSQKPLTFHKTQNEALDDSIDEQTACRPSFLVTRQRKHTQKIDQSACFFFCSEVEHPPLQPVSRDFLHRIFELLSQQLAQSTERHVRGSCVEDQSRFHSSRHQLSQSVDGLVTMQLYKVLACVPRG